MAEIPEIPDQATKNNFELALIQWNIEHPTFIRELQKIMSSDPESQCPVAQAKWESEDPLNL